MLKISNQIIKNLVSLTGAEVISKIIGLITAAYLGRVLKPEGFGILGFATAFVSYFLLMVNFGLDTYGTREVAKDNSLIAKLVNNILPMRLLFAFAWFIIFTIVVVLIDKSYTIKVVLLISAINLFTTAISINWIFMGIEKMWIISIRQILTNLFTLIGIILFVRYENNLIIAAVVTTLSGIINSLWLLFIYKKMYNKISFEFDLTFWKYIFYESLPLVFSSFMVAIYYNFDIVMLGYIKSERDVGIYSAAYKIILVGIVPFSLILNSFFPSLSKIGLIDSKEFWNTLKNYSLFMFTTGITIAAMLFFNSDLIIKIIFGSKYALASIPLSILTMNLLIVGVNIFFGNPLIAWGKQKQYSIAIALGAITNIILNIILIPKYSYIGAAYATLMSEVAVFVGVFYLFNKYTFKKLIV